VIKTPDNGEAAVSSGGWIGWMACGSAMISVLAQPAGQRTMATRFRRGYTA